VPNHWAKKVTRSRERELWRNQVRETCKQRTDLGSSFEYYGRTSRCSQLLLFLFLPPPQHSTQSSNFRCHISRAERSLSPPLFLSFFILVFFLCVCAFGLWAHHSLMGGEIERIHKLTIHATIRGNHLRDKVQEQHSQWRAQKTS
jgi:hypothetical protein